MSAPDRKRQLSLSGSGRSNRKRRLSFHQVATDRLGRGVGVEEIVGGCPDVGLTGRSDFAYRVSQDYQRECPRLELLCGRIRLKVEVYRFRKRSFRGHERFFPAVTD